MKRNAKCVPDVGDPLSDTIDHIEDSTHNEHISCFVMHHANVPSVLDLQRCRVNFHDSSVVIGKTIDHPQSIFV